MSRATPLVALSFREFLVKILKPEKDGVLELVKNVSCNPNTAGLYLLESRASSSKLAEGQGSNKNKTEVTTNAYLDKIFPFVTVTM